MKQDKNIKVIKKVNSGAVADLWRFVSQAHYGTFVKLDATQKGY